MRALLTTIVFLLLTALPAAAQELVFPSGVARQDGTLEGAMPGLAREAMRHHRQEDRRKHLDTLFRLQLVAGDDAGAIDSIRALRTILREAQAANADTAYFQYELLAKARLERAVQGGTVAGVFGRRLREWLAGLDDKTAFRAAESFQFDLDRAQADVDAALAPLAGKTSVTLAEFLQLNRAFQPFAAYREMLAPAQAVLAEEDQRRYAIQDDVLIRTKEGATLSAMVVRPRHAARPLPAILYFTIYTYPGNLREAIRMAAHGYAGIVADARGKRLSPDRIEPYRHEHADVNGVIDWIVRQPWSDGRVGMYGGSYSGFAQWAALKHGVHPALKTIAPYAAAMPGQGLPMENNIFLNVNYAWPFYVGNHKLLDDAIYRDNARWTALRQRWYASGRSYRDIDSIDGLPNPWLQEWLRHPAYDAYWQAMVPWRHDFEKIGIPILTVTGYYDDAQISALHYVREHLKRRPQADHVVLIGPYDHWTTQSTQGAVLNGYRLDPVAAVDVPALTFAWFDHVFHGMPRPALLKDKVNYQVMGANAWRHAPSLDRMATETLTLYLSDAQAAGRYVLTGAKPRKLRYITQVVDLADRTTDNTDYYPYPIVKDTLDLTGMLAFVSEPFDRPASVDGAFSGVLKAVVNKKDVDLNVVLYEITPEGRYFHLSYFLGRASHARDMEARSLLRPGRVETIPFGRSRVVSRQLQAGSRLLVVMGVNKNSLAQVNYGTGKNVSDESIADAGAPLTIRWRTDSRIRIPITR